MKVLEQKGEHDNERREVEVGGGRRRPSYKPCLPKKLCSI